MDCSVASRVNEIDGFFDEIRERRAMRERRRFRFVSKTEPWIHHPRAKKHAQCPVPGAPCPVPRALDTWSHATGQRTVAHASIIESFMPPSSGSLPRRKRCSPLMPPTVQRGFNIPLHAFQRDTHRSQSYHFIHTINTNQSISI